MNPNYICECGERKSRAAKQCMACYRERISPTVATVDTERDIGPVRNAFEWIILQSRGEIS